MRAVTLDKARPFLHERAHVVRDEVFGRRILVRGVVRNEFTRSGGLAEILFIAFACLRD